MAEKKVIFISFYTERYREEVKKLVSSLLKFGLAFYIEEIEDKGSWQRNAQHKPIFIKKMLEVFKNPVVWLDADAVVESYPGLFDEIDCDMACVYKGGEELLTSTVYFPYRAKALVLLEKWAQLCKEFPDKLYGDQKLLEGAIRDCNVFHLPETYAQIFDSMAYAGEPVISQWQASRKLKRGNV